MHTALAPMSAGPSGNLLPFVSMTADGCERLHRIGDLRPVRRLDDPLLPKGSGPHKHIWSDETFYLLDSEITILIRDGIRTAR